MRVAEHPSLATEGGDCLPASLNKNCLNHLSFDPASNNKSLQFGSAAGPWVSESPAENGSDPGKKRKRANVPPEWLETDGSLADVKSEMGDDCKGWWDYKDVVRLRREKIRRAKAQLELNLATAIKDNKKMFL
ncbi:hypothetical protein QYF61_012403 [Mycteria americana]|uniref:Uncharacterized protein n=1 Tax=Mycteria americana TaxID=33587 RepID=A0AAN7MQ93_MYCAM|nr:hypothetical protein QYF61_012403 [Mycteria americana]